MLCNERVDIKFSVKVRSLYVNLYSMNQDGRSIKLKRGGVRRITMEKRDKNTLTEKYAWTCIIKQNFKISNCHINSSLNQVRYIFTDRYLVFDLFFIWPFFTKYSGFYWTQHRGEFTFQDRSMIQCALNTRND